MPGHAVIAAAASRRATTTAPSAPRPARVSASSTISRTTPAGLESRASGASAEHLGLGARLVPRAAAPPRHEEQPRELVQRERSRAAPSALIADGVPEPDGARQRDDERDVRRLAPEARGELLHERLRRARPRRSRRTCPLRPALARRRCASAAMPAPAATGIEREARAARRVVARRDEDCAPPRAAPRARRGAPRR